MNKWMHTTRVAVFLVVMGFFGTACGKKDNPTPPPAPQIPNPTQGGFLGGFSGSCGGISGTPINNGQPFYATLSGGYSQANSMTVTLAYPATGNYGQTTALVGSAQIVLQDLQQMFGQYVQQTSFCVSSVDPSNGALSYGSLTNGTYVSLSMSGIIQVPSMSYAPYGYPGTQSFQPLPVRVDISNGYIQNGRIGGTAVIDMGQLGSIPYQMDSSGYGGGYYDPYGGGYGGGYGNYDPYYGYSGW